MYDEHIPKYGDIMTVEEFIEACKCGAFIDYDGFGNPAKDGYMSSMIISPSRLSQIPLDATHIVWYNR